MLWDERYGGDVRLRLVRVLEELEDLAESSALDEDYRYLVQNLADQLDLLIEELEAEDDS